MTLKSVATAVGQQRALVAAAFGGARGQPYCMQLHMTCSGQRSAAVKAILPVRQLQDAWRRWTTINQPCEGCLGAFGACCSTTCGIDTAHNIHCRVSFLGADHKGAHVAVA